MRSHSTHMLVLIRVAWGRGCLACTCAFAAVLQAFLSQSTDKNRFEIKEALMPDSMHPSTVGMRIIATRLEPVISKLLLGPPGESIAGGNVFQLLR